MQIIINGLIVGSIYALLAMGFSLQYTTSRFFNLSYGIIALYGGLITSSLSNDFPLWFAIICGVLSSAVLSLICHKLVFNPLKNRGASASILLVMSFALLIILQNTAALVPIWGNSTHDIGLKTTVNEGLKVSGVILTFPQVLMFLGAMCLFISLELFLQKSSIGLQIKAVGDNRVLSKAIGISLEKIEAFTFFIVGILSSTAVILIGLETGVSIHLGLMFVLKAIIASIVGGASSIRGALVGGLILGLTESIGMYFSSAQWRDVIAFSLLAVVLIVLPQGIFGKEQAFR